VEGGQRIFRNVNPIANEPECYGCHGSRDKIIGVLISDFSMADVDERLATKFREMLLSLAITILVTVATISFAMNRLIIGRLERFVRATKLLGSGRLDQEVRPGHGPDPAGPPTVPPARPRPGSPPSAAAVEPLPHEPLTPPPS
jgi:hypothetical protein